MAVAFMQVVSALFPRILSRVWNVGGQCGPGVSKGLDNLAIPTVSVRPRRPSELSSEALARSVEKLARMNRKLARELPIT